MFSSSSENGVKIPLATLVSVKVNSPAYAMMCGVELQHCNERQALRLAGSLLLPELIQTISIVILNRHQRMCRWTRQERQHT